MPNPVPPNTTSYVTTVFIQDSTSTTGAGKTGLAYNTSGLTCYYKRSNGTASVALSLANITTLGTFVSGGFKEIDATHMPGLYEFDPSNAALASGATGVTFFFTGATGMAPAVLKVDLSSVWDEINTGATHNINNSTGKQLRTVSPPGTGVIYSGTLPSQSGMTSTQVKLDSGASAVDNAYQWEVFSELTGADAGDSGTIVSYNGSTKVATVSQPWQVQPVAGDTFEITPAAQVQVVSYVSGQAPLQPTVAGRTLAVSSAGGVTLADGVAHGGTPGSSTATLAMQEVHLSNASGSSLYVETTAANGVAAQILGSGSSNCTGLVIAGNGNAAIQLYGDAAGQGTPSDVGVIYVEASSGARCIRLLADDSADTVSIESSDGHGINIAPGGTNKHGINVTGGSTSGDAVHKTATDGHGDYSAGGNGKAAVVPGTLAIGS